MENTTHHWVATLSDGTVAIENKGDWSVVEGERKPWVRLCDHLVKNNLHITSLRYNANGTTYHAPRLNDRFMHGGEHPETYSIQYIYERDEGSDGVTETQLVDIGAQYEGFSVNQVIELDDQSNGKSWVQVRRDFVPMAPARAKGDR